ASIVFPGACCKCLRLTTHTGTRGCLPARFACRLSVRLTRYWICNTTTIFIFVRKKIFQAITVLPQLLHSTWSMPGNTGGRLTNGPQPGEPDVRLLIISVSLFSANTYLCPNLSTLDKQIKFPATLV